jgi:hypothetical protein
MKASWPRTDRIQRARLDVEDPESLSPSNADASTNLPTTSSSVLMLLGAVDGPQELGTPTSIKSGALTSASEPCYELSGVGLRRQPAEKAPTNQSAIFAEVRAALENAVDLGVIERIGEGADAEYRLTDLGTLVVHEMAEMRGGSVNDVLSVMGRVQDGDLMLAIRRLQLKGYVEEKLPSASWSLWDL